MFAALAAVATGACGEPEAPTPAQVAELAALGGSTVQGQATASSRQGLVRVSAAFHGLPGPSTLRLAVRPGACPTATPASTDEGPDGGATQEPLARIQVTTEGTSGAAQLTFPAADLPAGGDVAIVLTDFTGVALACGEVGAIPVTEPPEGGLPETEPRTPPEPPNPEETPADGGVSA